MKHALRSWEIAATLAVVGASPILGTTTAFAGNAGAGTIKSAILDEVAQTYTPQAYANHVWTMVAAALVLGMQAGFLMLEAGLSRTASAINVAVKNLIDFIVAACFFYVLGFGLMFGASETGWIGTSLFMPNAPGDPWFHTFFVFQLVFAGTTATIVSGAVAERTRIHAYVVMTVVCVLIYTIGGHWAWGNLYNPDSAAWLADLGFVDFAGSTVVHSTGGWLALAAAIVVGARRGRFGPNARTFQPNNAAWATLGTLLLWIGWIGFNGGSTTAATPAFAHIVANTMLAGAFGGLTAITLGLIRDGGVLRPERPMVGVLAGLVAVTAGCQVLDLTGAVLIGASGAVVAVLAEMLLARLHVDDVVGAAPVHGFAGAWGTLALALLAPADSLPAGGAWAQLQVQAVGVGAFFAWTFGVGLAVLWSIDRVWRHLDAAAGRTTSGFRVSPQVEARGLNAEHGVTLGTAVVQDALRDIVDKGDLRREVAVDPGDENAEIAHLVNRMRQAMLSVIDGITSNADALAAAAERVVDAAGMVGEQAQTTRTSAEAAKGDSIQTARAAEEVRGLVRHLETDLATVSDRADDIAERVSRASESARRIRESSEQAGARADETRAEVERASSATHDAGERIAALNDVAEQIHSTARTISDIAERTRLVALNASIEASQAGGAGRGFAVVADEVKTLSDKVDRAARDIGDLAGRITAGSTDAAQATQDIGAVVARVDEAVRSTVGVAREAADLARDVETAVTETDTAAEGVSGAVQSIRQHADKAGEHADTVASDSDDVAGRMQQVRTAAGRNDELARDLNAAADDIRARIAELRRMTGRNHTGGQGALASPRRLTTA